MKEQTTVKELETERLPPEPDNATSTDIDDVSEEDRQTIAAVLAAEIRALTN